MTSKKNKKSKKRNVKHQYGSMQKNELKYSPLAFWSRQFVLLSTLIAGLILLITALQTNWFNELPTSVQWIINISGLIISVIRMSKTIYGYKNKAYLLSKRAALLDAVLVAILYVIGFTPLLIGTSAIDKFAAWVNSIMPIVNQVVSKVIAWILTFAIPSAVSGVIGNFVYDALKKISTSKEKR